MKKFFINRNIFLLCIGSFISSIGDNLYNIGLTLAMYSMSGSVKAVAGMWLIRALVRIPGQFISGIVVDKFNRKNIMSQINIFSGVICFLLIFVNDSNMYLAYIIIFILQATSDIDNSAAMAIIPEIVEKDELTDVNNLFSIISTITLFLAPAIGGFAYMRYGAAILYILNAISFLFGGIMYSMISYSPVAREVRGEHKFTLFKFAIDGYRTVLDKKAVLIIILSMGIFAILGRLYEIYKIYIADHIFEVGSVGIVYFSYAMAFGSLLAPLLIKYLTKKNVNNTTFLTVVSIMTSVGFLMFGMSREYIIACSAVFVIGLFQSCMSVFINCIIQREIESQYLGRVFSFYRITTMFSAIFGILVAPYLLDLVGASIPLAFFSIVGMMIVTVFYIMNKRITKVENTKVAKQV